MIRIRMIVPTIPKPNMAVSLCALQGFRLRKTHAKVSWGRLADRRPGGALIGSRQADLDMTALTFAEGERQLSPQDRIRALPPGPQVRSAGVLKGGGRGQANCVHGFDSHRRLH